MNYKNLNYEIETIPTISFSADWKDAMNYKNLNYEIETTHRPNDSNSLPTSYQR